MASGSESQGDGQPMGAGKKIVLSIIIGAAFNGLMGLTGRLFVVSFAMHGVLDPVINLPDLGLMQQAGTRAAGAWVVLGVCSGALLGLLSGAFKAWRGTSVKAFHIGLLCLLDTVPNPVPVILGWLIDRFVLKPPAKESKDQQGKWIRDVERESGLSPEEFAKAVGASTADLAKWEWGKDLKKMPASVREAIEGMGKGEAE